MLSVIIPVLNPTERFAAVLQAVNHELAGLGADIIVVSAGMDEVAKTACRQAQARIVESLPGRGIQLATGANTAQQPWLLFLHGDTLLGAGSGSLAAIFMMDPINEHRAGWFRLSFDDDAAGATRVADAANWRARKLGLPYGDQGLLISQSLYQRLGGYAAQPLMEDVDLARRIGKSRLVEIDGSVETSADRYRQGGYWLRPARNLFCLFLFYCHVPLRLIDKIYRGLF